MQVGDKKYSLVKIVWEDIIHDDSTWKTIEESLDWADDSGTIVHQVGYLLDEDENHYVLAGSMFTDGSQVSIITKIPRGTVKKIDYLD